MLDEILISITRVLDFLLLWEVPLMTARARPYTGNFGQHGRTGMNATGGGGRLLPRSAGNQTILIGIGD